MFILDYNPDDLIAFMLILVRVATFVFIVPAFGGNMVSGKFKITTSFVLSFVVYLAVRPEYVQDVPHTMMKLILSGARECVVGILIGLATGIVFYAVMLAGRLIGNQMGIGLASVIAPESGERMSILSQFYFLFALVLFVTVDGHQMLLSGLMESFRFLPAGEPSIPVKSMRELLLLSNNVFVIAIQIASSLMVMLLLVSASLGVIARTVPQMNIFVVGLPLRLFVALIGMSIAIPYVATALAELFRRIPEDMARVMGAS
ncbi:flagellar biosynthetic protein FliR [bacterium]|nr:flagellar biosynthetic protein FliR [bacterium]